MERPKIKDYTRLVTQKALQAWRKLPPQPRRWVDPEDLVQDGLLFTKKIIPKWRPHRASFCTFLTISLEQFYSRVLAAHYTEKRSKCELISVDSVLYRLSEPDPLEQEVQAVEALRKVASVASPVLRRYLKNWFLVRSHLHYRGEQYREAREEMRLLAKHFGFDRRDMEFLLYNESWRRGVDLRLDC